VFWTSLAFLCRGLHPWTFCVKGFLLLQIIADIYVL
jgi:hypothetical protein